MRNVLQVKVTNKNDFTIEDRFDGILYVLEAKKTVSIPYEAACHIFGVNFAPDATGFVDPNLRDAMFAHLQRRWGWNRSDRSKDPSSKASRAKFDKLEFSLVRMAMVEQTVDENEPLPEPAETARKGRKEVA